MLANEANHGKKRKLEDIKYIVVHYTAGMGELVGWAIHEREQFLFFVGMGKGKVEHKTGLNSLAPGFAIF